MALIRRQEGPSTADLEPWENNEPQKLASDGFVVIQPQDLSREAPIQQIPIGSPEHHEEMTDDTLATPPPAQKQEAEEARFIGILEAKMERVVYRTTARLAKEVARLGRDLQKANELINTFLKNFTTNNAATTTNTDKAQASNT